MNREDALIDFKSKMTEKYITKYNMLLIDTYNNNKTKIHDMIFQAIKSIIDKGMLHFNFTKNKIAMFQFEILRTDILNESFKITLHGYNSYWYLDENPVYDYVDFKFLFKPLIELRKELETEMKVYIGKINKYDVQNILFTVAIEFFNNMSSDVRKWLWNLDDNEWIKVQCINEFYKVRWGEYQGKSEIVFAMDHIKKDTKDFLQLGKQDEHKKPYVYSVWRESIINNCKINDRNMLFVNFKESSLEKVEFVLCKMISAQFENCNMNETSFIDTILAGTSFCKANLSKCSFEKSNLFGSDFSNSYLNNVNFNKCNLSKSIFVNATIENVSFENADVSDAIFSSKSVPYLHLTPEQLQTIYISEA